MRKNTNELNFWQVGERSNSQLRGIQKLGIDEDKALSLKEFFKKQQIPFVLWS